MFIVTILVIGLSGVVAQVILLRELLVSFNGNELTLGVILANWVILEALGALLVGKFIEKARSGPADIFVFLQIVFSVSLTLCIFLARTFKSTILGIPAEAVGINTVFYASLLITLPLAFCHGALFSAFCKLESLFSKDRAGSIGRVYSFETAGTILGGIILTYLFLPYLNSFQTAFIIAVINALIALRFLRYASKKLLKAVAIGVAGVMLWLLFSGAARRINDYAIHEQWKKVGKVLDYRNSIYGNIVVSQKDSQLTFFYNGIPVITTPYPDITFVEEFGNLPLLFHSQPEDALVLSAGAGGLINEILKHPIKRLDYAELDPLLIQLLKAYPSALTQKELSDTRVQIKNADGRYFLRTTAQSYDVILIGLSNPSDLSTNRMFTQEFFSLAKKKLRPDGILALWLPGSLTYISEEIKDLNACIINALKIVFSSVRIIPGDFNLLLASAQTELNALKPAALIKRLNERNIQTKLLNPAYLDYRLSESWLKWFERSTATATTKINRDLRPIAVFNTLLFWNKQFSPALAKALKATEGLNIWGLFIFICAITALLFWVFHRQAKYSNFTVAYAIATTGFFGMLANLLLIFSFQVFYGYLYQMLGLFISVFMAGICAGSMAMTRFMKKCKNDFKLFITLEIVIGCCGLLLALLISFFAQKTIGLSFLFAALFFLPGFLLGLEFPLASKIYLQDRRKIGETAGKLYFADLLGGWVAGILAGVVFLPVLGLLYTCLVMAIFKVSSITLLAARPRIEKTS